MRVIEATQEPDVTGHPANAGMSETALRVRKSTSEGVPSEWNQPIACSSVSSRPFFAFAADLQVDLAVWIAHRRQNVDDVVFAFGKNNRRGHIAKMRLLFIIKLEKAMVRPVAAMSTGVGNSSAILVKPPAATITFSAV